MGKWFKKLGSSGWQCGHPGITSLSIQNTISQQRWWPYKGKSVLIIPRANLLLRSWNSIILSRILNPPLLSFHFPAHSVCTCRGVGVAYNALGWGSPYPHDSCLPVLELKVISLPHLICLSTVGMILSAIRWWIKIFSILTIPPIQPSQHQSYVNIRRQKAFQLTIDIK